MTHRKRLIVLAAFATLAALASPTVALAQTKLIGTVSDPATISLTTESGTDVHDIPAGTYTIEVRDQSIMHNFHLSGPGVDQRTEVETIGTVTWTVTLQDRARYTFVCDPHNTTLRGSFTTGGGPPAQPPPPPPKIQTLTATVGPGATISLRTQSRRADHSVEGRPLPDRRPRQVVDAQLPPARTGCEQEDRRRLPGDDDLDGHLPEGQDLPLPLRSACSADERELQGDVVRCPSAIAGPASRGRPSPRRLRGCRPGDRAPSSAPPRRAARTPSSSARAGG